MLKKLLNVSERIVHDRLAAACKRNSARVFAKVRVADIFPIENSGLSRDLYRFALQSHFDFVIVDPEDAPLFGVEFDGPYHDNTEQVLRDAKKDALSERFDFPLIRINTRHLERKYRGLDLLTWFVEVWFSSKDFETAQQRGLIPWTEPFDPALILNIPGLSGNFPLWISAEPRIALQKLHERGKCKDYIPSDIIGLGSEGLYRGISFIRINNTHGVSVTAKMKCQQFPLSESDTLDEILPFLLHQKVSEAISNPDRLESLGDIAKKIDRFRRSIEWSRQTLSGNWSFSG